MGPIALLVVVWVLPILAGLVLLAVAGVAVAVQWIAGLPVVAWAPSAAAIVAGYAGGLWIGRARRSGSPRPPYSDPSTTL